MARTDTLPNFLTDVADAIRTKAGTSDPIQASAFDTAIANIPAGGESGWQRPSDWWDTETILANAENKTDSQGNTVYPAYILLLADWDKETTFSATASNAALQGDGYLTSDGAWYGTSEATHTWDTTKDKPCSEGYKTRYVIVYAKGTITGYIMMKLFKCLEMITGNITISSFPVFGDTSSGNDYIRNFVIGQNTTISYSRTTSTLSNCRSLKSVYVPTTQITQVANSSFYYCYGLEKVYFSNVTAINGVGNFTMCYGLKKLSFPKLTTLPDIFSQLYSLEELEVPSLTSITTANRFLCCPNLKKLTIPSTCTTFPTKSGTNPLFSKYIEVLELYEDFEINNVDLTDDINLTRTCLIDILNKLKDVTGESETYTLTLGSTNLAKLTADEIAIGTAKGWTID